MATPSKAVFLSYASQDAEAAGRVCEALRAAGIEAWLDQSELRGGDAWDQKIRQQVRDCALFIPIISANTAARHEGYFRLEWNLADERTHMMARNKPFIVPVCIDATPDTGADVPESFLRAQWTRLPAGQTPPAFAERVLRLLEPEVAAAEGDPKPQGRSSVAGAPRRKLMLGAAALVVLLGAVAVVTFRLMPRGTAVGSVAVLPFENATGDPSIQYLSDGISESLINKLSGLSGLRVISRTSAFAFRGAKLDPMEIGRKLGVDALVTGSLVQRGADLAITAELVSMRDASQLWGEKYSRRADDMLQVEGEIAGTIARTLRLQLSGEEKARLARASTSDPEAYRLYLKARGFLVGTQQEMDKSIDLFQQAVARAPGYALAHAGLAEAYTRQAFLRASGRKEPLANATAAVKRALELDPNLAEAHTALGLVRFFFEWDWAGAEAELRRAVELNAGSSAAHEEYGGFLTAMGRLDEGLRHSREAARLDPLSLGPAHDVGINAMLRNDFEQAAAEFRRTIQIDPNWTWGYIKLARALAHQKKCAESLEQSEIGERKIAGGAAPSARSWLARNYAMCGEVAKARQKLEEIREQQKKRYVDPMIFAAIHAALGENDEAVRWVEKAYEDRSPNLVWSSQAQRFDPELASHPRFKAIVGRMGFPPRGG